MSTRTHTSLIMRWCVPWSSIQGQDRILGEGRDGASDCGHGLVQCLLRLWGFVVHHERAYHHYYHHDMVCARVQHAGSGWILGRVETGVRVRPHGPVQPFRRQWGFVLYHEHTYPR
jgi:hypothetical protein